MRWTLWRTFVASCRHSLLAKAADLVSFQHVIKLTLVFDVWNYFLEVKDYGLPGWIIIEMREGQTVSAMHTVRYVKNEIQACGFDIHQQIEDTQAFIKVAFLFVYREPKKVFNSQCCLPRIVASVSPACLLLLPTQRVESRQDSQPRPGLKEADDDRASLSQGHWQWWY